ncbi:MFS transporter [Picrophilus oshimae]|uniref:Major Facilitator Superfamily protein n=1 Tax=Picrophilus torridus (strain ATCC 700027 / DSM 9790 / JCM 10055 / NBRC 100828 / KAW 2/3) TaxID=1122961 RepID=A0A8G2FXJ4_PICTO|nr:MFS transporter [Picrophilus oshimae]SMD31291.1 Major Facilitator Superfamily protein [Picrophilus oshimae DSM 9789]
MEQKWVALSNTTIGQLMATINTSIIVVALPPIFRGIHLNPLAHGTFPYLLWSIISYMIVISVLLLTIGRLSDMYGRVRLFNLGFLIFTIGSILLYVLPGTGTTAALELIIFRMFQAVGGSFLMANSFAIITDNFPDDERAFALSINSVASIIGVSVGVVAGGILSIIYWRDVFLISVPVGIFGTVWSFLKLKETSPRVRHRIDLPGNITFAAGIVLILLGITYGIVPYNAFPMGWEDPYVVISVFLGLALLILFIYVEKHVDNPMFRLDFFKNTGFSIGNFTGFVSAMGMMGLMYMLTILFQGVWLPIHGYPYYITPFWAGVYILPMTIAMGIFGIIGGRIANRNNIRLLTSLGLFISSFSFILIAFLPYDFSYPELAFYLVIFGIGYGLFNAPNISAVMSSVPGDSRGSASGMLNTMRNLGYTASMGLFFSILIYGLSLYLPGSIKTHLNSIGASSLSLYISKMPATEALFSAFLGINPVPSILSTVNKSVLSKIEKSTILYISGNTWYPHVLAPAFGSSFSMVFYIAFAITLISGIISIFREPLNYKIKNSLRSKEYVKK